MDDTATIDGAGRLVIPKPVRTRLQLRRGTRLRIVEDRGRIFLEPIAEVAQPVEVNGILVLRGRLRGPLPDHRELRDPEARRERP